MSVGDDLLEALQALGSAGSFWAAGSVANAPLGLDIDDFGAMSFPFNPAQANELRRVCYQAPYGQGEKTLVDTNVRRVWVLDADKFRLTSPGWKKTLDGIVKNVQGDLGLGKEKLDAHLYNLLLYEEGSFFLPHRDGERLDRMVATLVIVLPCSFEGGELLVRHEGQEKSFTFGAGEPNPGTTLHYAAFYADCEHEVRPLTQGQRVCLVYNLTLAKAKKKSGVPTAPLIRPQVEAVAGVLRTWAQQPEPAKLALALAHQYSQTGLVWDALKGVDRVWADVVAETARQAGFVVHLALVTLWEEGEGEEEDYPQRRGGGRGSRYNDDEEDDDEDEDDDEEEKPAPVSTGSGKIRRDAEGRALGEHEMLEVSDSSLTAGHWSTPAGTRPAFGNMTLQPEEVVPSNAVTHFTPEEDYEGYTGNEGCPLERWYRRAVLMLWPVQRHFDALSACGPASALESLGGLLDHAAHAEAGERDRLRQQCHDFAARLLGTWPKRNPYSLEDPKVARPDPFAALVKLDAPDLVVAYLQNVFAQDASETAEQLLPLCERHGWPTFQSGFLAVFAATAESNLARNAKLFQDIALAETAHKKARNELCGNLVEPMLAGLEANSSQPSRYYQPADRSAFLASLVRGLIATGQVEPFERFHKHLADHAQFYPLEQQTTALTDVHLWLKTTKFKVAAGLSKWLDTVLAQLRWRTAKQPTAPTDFTRTANFRCACADCAELKKFLADAGAGNFRFARAEKLRKHLLSSISEGSCDVKHTIDPHRTPHVLVLTKTQASYEAALAQYHNDCQRLAHLETLLPAPAKSKRKKKD